MAPGVKQGSEGVVAAVRVLHRPSEGLFPECQGCDGDGYDAEWPDWPCRTAQLVYSEAEIEAVGRATRERRAAYRATRKPAGPVERMLPEIWAGRITEMLKPPLIGGFD